MKKYYVYQHKDLNNKVFYIGKGTLQNSSRNDGFDRAFSKGGRNKDWKVASKDGYSVEIVKMFTDEADALDYELALTNTCISCVNSRHRKNELSYTVECLDEDTFKLLFLKSVYFLHKEGYISNTRGRVLKTLDNGHGYQSVVLSCGTKNKKRYYLHRLLASAFLENPNNKPQVNHIDLNRANNNVNNLEWCTPKENVDYSNNLGSYKGTGQKVILQLDYKGNLIKTWNGAAEAANILGCTTELISGAANQSNFSCFSAKEYLWIKEEDYLSGNTKALQKALDIYKDGFKVKDCTNREIKPAKTISVEVRNNIIKDFVLELENNHLSNNQIAIQLSNKYKVCKKVVFSYVNHLDVVKNNNYLLLKEIKFRSLIEKYTGFEGSLHNEMTLGNLNNGEYIRLKKYFKVHTDIDRTPKIKELTKELKQKHLNGELKCK